MDFITRSLESQGQYVILVVVEQIAKLTHMVLNMGTATSLETALPFVK